MSTRYLPMEHVRGFEAPESQWLTANGLEIIMIPVNQNVEIWQVDGSPERIRVSSFVRDASGQKVIAGEGYLKVTAQTLLTVQPEAFGLTPIEDPQGA